jgi:hypothetical protein
MASLLSCTRIRGESPTATVQLTFDTVRRDHQERVYVMDEKDAQVNKLPLELFTFLVFYCDVL